MKKINRIEEQHLVMDGKSADLPISPNIIEIDGIFYYCNPETGKASVLNGRSCSDSVFIPESVVKEDVTYPVTSIDNNAFLGSGITTIIIPDSISTIGDNAFKDCVSLRIVGIGKSVISIGAAAFAGCYRIVSVTIPDSVVEIGTEAFQNCEGITSVIFGFSVFRIGIAAFAGCVKLESVAIPEKVTVIAESLFEGCSSLTSVIISGAVKIIRKYAFADCINLGTVDIPSTVEKIGDYAFADCISMKKIILSDIAKWCQIKFGKESNPFHFGSELWLKSNSGTTRISQLDIHNGVVPSGAFSKCPSFSSVVFHQEVTEIGEGAFDGCSGLNRIDFGDAAASIGNRAFADCIALKSLTIGKNVKSIGERSFANCFNLRSVTIYPSVKSIGNFAFSECFSLESVTVYDMRAWCNIDFGIGSNPLLYVSAFYHIENARPKPVVDLKLPDDIQVIKSRAFQGYKGLESVILPDEATLIGASAFADCVKLNKVTVGRSVITIEDEAFGGCSNINKVVVFDTGKWCGIDFKGIHSNPLEYGRALYLDKTRISELVIPDGVTQIKPRAFYNCRSISSVTIPESVEKIGEDAFFQCCGLEEVCISDIAKWCSIDFEYSGQGDIESNPLIYAHRLHLKNETEDEMITDLVIPDGVERINQGAFCGFSSMTSVVFPDSLTSIDGYVFCDCSKLAKVFFPNPVSKIGAHAFSGCCNMDFVFISGSVTSIGEFAFYGCTNLSIVSISDLNAWCNIIFNGAHSNPLEYAHRLFLEDAEEQISSLVTDLVIPKGVEWIGARAFINCTCLTSVTFGYDVRSIGIEAFKGCSSLKSVTIGKSVDAIGEEAFDFCDSLTEVRIYDIKAWCNIEFGSNPLEIAHKLYLNDIEVANLEILDGVETIRKNSFSGCTNLRILKIGDSVRTIEEAAFSGCSDLRSVTISHPVDAIGKSSFRGCSSLRSLDIGYTVKTIGENAFSGCIGLESVTIPDLVETIGNNAFYGCKGMTDVTMGKRVTNIGPNAFTGCSKLKKVHVDDIVAYCRINFEGSGSNPLELTHNIYTLGDNHISDLSILQGVSKIQPGIFARCYDLNKVTIGETVSEPSSQNSMPDKNGSGGVSIIGENAFLECFNLTEVTIGDSVKTIEAGAFQVCTKLATLSIGKSVMKIGFGAFFNCAMTSVTIPESVMRIEGLAFYCKDLSEIRCMNRFPIPISENVFKNYDATLEVPSGSKKFYSEDEIWGKFKNIIEPPSGVDTTVGDTTSLVDSQP